MNNTNNISVLNTIKIGLELLKKKTKTKAEQKAAKSFKKTFSTLFLIFLLWIILFTLVVIIFYPTQGFSGIKKYGTVEDGYVKYIQKDDRYLPISALGIGDSVEEGDSVLLFFDSSDGSLIRAIPNSEYKAITYGKFIVIIVTAILGMVALTSYTTVSRKKTGKDFYNFIEDNMQ